MSNVESILKEKYGFENPFKTDALAEKALHYLKKETNLLDIGCGEGADTVFFANNGFRVTALDFNETHLDRLQTFLDDNSIKNATIVHTDILDFQYPLNHYEVINCLLVGCCMLRSDFEALNLKLRLTLKKGGILIMSLRNYLDPQFVDYVSTEKMIEPNTFTKRDDCCEIRYYIEKNRLLESFHDFEILYYFEGFAKDKYEEIEQHGDSYIICRKLE
ncbi:Methyltransferase domain-containing protein [Flavobacteriaceae bacterium MAR_2010_188]|nr:Methyltransferase domain-containing protein [Flavobacteriaceae bacterium MAR_2010_188]